MAWYDKYGTTTQTPQAPQNQQGGSTQWWNKYMSSEQAQKLSTPTKTTQVAPVSNVFNTPNYVSKTPGPTYQSNVAGVPVQTSIYNAYKPIEGESQLVQAPVKTENLWNKITGFIGNLFSGGQKYADEKKKAEDVNAMAVLKVTGQPLVENRVKQLAKENNMPYEQAKKGVENLAVRNKTSIYDVVGLSPSALAKPGGNPFRNSLMEEVTKEIGIRQDPTNADAITTFTTIALAGGLVNAPLATIKAIGMWEGVSKITSGLISAVKGEGFKPMSGYTLTDLYKGENESIPVLLDTIDFLGKAFIVSGAYKAQPRITEKLTKDLITKYNLPKTLNITPELAKDILTGRNMGTPEAEFLKRAGFGASEYKTLIKQGGTISIPSEKAVWLVDKPYWAKFKQALGKTSEDKLVSGGGAKAKVSIDMKQLEAPKKTSTPTGQVQNQKEYAYHGTQGKNLQGIKEKGLIRGVFSSDLETPKEYGKETFTGKENATILRVKSTELDYKLSSAKSDKSIFAESTKSIPPEKLEVSTDGGKTWKPLVDKKTPTQTTQVQNPATEKGQIATQKLKTDPNKALIQEAKKYSSAEEFINAQPKMYHGTDNKTLENIKSKGFKSGSEGYVSLTDDIEIAKQFAEGRARAMGGSPVVVEVDPKSTKITRNFDPNDLESIRTQEREFIVEPKDTKNLRLFDKAQLTDIYNQANKKIDLNKAKQTPVIKPKEYTDSTDFLINYYHNPERQVGKVSKSVEKEFEKFKPTENITLYRGLAEDVSPLDRNSKRFGVESWTKDRNTALLYANNNIKNLLTKTFTPEEILIDFTKVNKKLFPDVKDEIGESIEQQEVLVKTKPETQVTKPKTAEYVDIKKLQVPEFNNGIEINGWRDVYRNSDAKTIDKMDKDINYLLENKNNELAPILVKKSGEFLDVEDGHHRVASYLSAGREQIPYKLVEPKTEIKPKTVSVPREQLPVGTGEERVSKLEARVKQAVGNISQSQIDELGLSTYKQLSNETAIREATKYVLEKPEEALQVLEGKIETPKGLLRNAIYVAMQQQAVGDLSLATKLASLSSTKLGQEIQILSQVDKNSPVSIINEVYKIKAENLARKYKVKDIEIVKDKMIKQAKQQIKAPTTFDWGEIIKEVRC